MTLLPSGCWRMQSIFGRRRKPIGLSVQAKLCQDIIIKAIAQSSLNRNVTIKGGVVVLRTQDGLRRTWIWILLNIPYQKNLYDYLLQN